MRQTKKIAFITRSFIPGGVERVMQVLAIDFSGFGYSVLLLGMSPHGKLQENVPHAVRISNLGIENAEYKISWISKFLAAFRLNRILVESGIETVVTAKEQVLLVVFIANFIRLVSRRKRLKVLHTRHAPVIGEDVEETSSFIRLFMRIAYRKVDQIVAVSNEIKHQLLDITRLPKERVTCIYNPLFHGSYSSLVRLVESCDLPPAIQLAKNEGVPIVCAIGRLHHQKGFDLLLRSMALIKEVDWRLFIAGEGNELSELRQLAQMLDIADRVVFLGHVSYARALLFRSNLYVLSSRWEGLPLTLIEAAVLSPKIVAFDCPTGVREILSGMPSAVIVEPNNVIELASAIRRFLIPTITGDDAKARAAKFQLFTSTRASMAYLRLVEESE